MSIASSPATNGVMPIEMVAGYMHFTERTIYRLAAATTIPALSVDGSCRFPRGGIDICVKQKS